MRLSAGNTGAGKDAAAPSQSGPITESVAGRIEARPSELAAAVEKWHARLTARKLKCAGDYRAVLRKAILDEGWVSFEDFEAGAMPYLDAKVNSGDWKGVTYNRNLQVIKSFSSFLSKLRKVPDLIADADWAKDDRDDLIRPATVEEARSIMRYALACALVDKRATMETAVSMAIALGMGLRPREPDKLRWKHLKLDAPVEHVWWKRDIQKNNRDQIVAMSTEMAQVLKAHRERALKGPAVHVRRRKHRPAEIRPIDPRDPEAFVFGETFSHATFRKYVRKCQLGGDDEYGRRITPRSCRMFYKTEILAAGAAGDMVRHLMRHKAHADEGYFKPNMERMRAAGDLLPRIWPGPGEAGMLGARRGRVVDNQSLHDVELTRASRRCNPLPARHHVALSNQPLENAPREARDGALAESVYGSVGGVLEALSQPVLSPGGGSADLSPGVMNPAMARTRFITRPDRTALADLFGALDRLLRGAAREPEPKPLAIRPRRPQRARRA